MKGGTNKTDNNTALNLTTAKGQNQNRKNKKQNKTKKKAKQEPKTIKRNQEKQKQNNPPFRLIDNIEVHVYCERLDE